MLKIECYYYESCGSIKVLPARLEEALDREQAQASVTHQVVSMKEGQRLGILGSPTVLIDGKDILEGGGQSGGT